jgi:hypothetical protein
MIEILNIWGKKVYISVLHIVALGEAEHEGKSCTTIATTNGEEGEYWTYEPIEFIRTKVTAAVL